jgi:hypothetical protein
MKAWCTLAVFGSSVLCFVCRAAGGSDFPPIEPGVWKVEATRTLPNGETQKWTRTGKYCEFPLRVFEGYWGVAKLRKSGCVYSGVRISAELYQVDTLCEISGGRTASAKSMVTLSSGRAFEMQVEHHEGEALYRASVTARRVADCKD